MENAKITIESFDWEVSEAIFVLFPILGYKLWYFTKNEYKFVEEILR